jgi:SAM-dependent methyltransferase
MKEAYQKNYWAKWEHFKNPALRQRKARKIQVILEEAVPGIAYWGGWALDVGCSIGMISEHFARVWPGWRVVGVDIDEDALSLSSAGGASAIFCLGDAMCLPFPSGAFDLVLCVQVYEHVPDWRRLLREVHRVLKPGGVCFFSGPNRWFIIEEHYRVPLLSWFPRPLAHWAVRWSGKAPFYYERPVSWWTLRGALRAYGFEVEDYTYRLLEDPLRFHIEGRWVQWISKWIRFFPTSFRRYLTPFLPNFNLVLRKPFCTQ